MWIISDDCLCEECSRKHCKKKKIIIKAQELLANVEDKHTTVRVEVTKCKYYKK